MCTHCYNKTSHRRLCVGLGLGLRVGHIQTEGGKWIDLYGLCTDLCKNDSLVGQSCSDRFCSVVQAIEGREMETQTGKLRVWCETNL